MIAFAANSLLCRVALRSTSTDAASFTAIRLFSGAIVLYFVTRIRGRSLGGDWISASALFIYAAAFSFAYLSLPAGTGALLLFAAVQGTMISVGLTNGESMRAGQWFGFMLALAALVFLLAPGISAPPLAGSILMLSAGAAWGVYSLRGRNSGDATGATAGNFLRTLPPAAVVSLITMTRAHVDLAGTAWATVSGAITSGLGYVIWYAVLPSLRSTTAATVQLSAPVLAALGGILFLGEAMSLRFVISAAGVLGGIWLVTGKRSRQALIGPSGKMTRP